MRLALYQPDIPQNTGTIIRTCACFGVGVDLIGPMGFILSEKKLRRAGLDYLEMAEVTTHPSWDEFGKSRAQEDRPGRLVLFTTKATTPYWDHVFAPDDTILLGSETSGVPDDVHASVDAKVIIPMRDGVRSLNLAVAAGMALGEAVRQVR